MNDEIINDTLTPHLQQLIARCQRPEDYPLAGILHTIVAARITGVENQLLRHVAVFTRQMLDAAFPTLDPSRIITEPCGGPVCVWVETHYAPGAPNAPASGYLGKPDYRPTLFPDYWDAANYIVDANLAAAATQMQPGQLAIDTLYIVKPE